MRFVMWRYTPVPALTIVIFTAGGADPGWMGPWTYTSSAQSSIVVSALQVSRLRRPVKARKLALASYAAQLISQGSGLRSLPAPIATAFALHARLIALTRAGTVAVTGRLRCTSSRPADTTTAKVTMRGWLDPSGLTCLWERQSTCVPASLPSTIIHSDWTRGPGSEALQ